MVHDVSNRESGIAISSKGPWCCIVGDSLYAGLVMFKMSEIGKCQQGIEVISLEHRLTIE
jgi:hypothetical protein